MISRNIQTSPFVPALLALLVIITAAANDVKDKLQVIADGIENETIKSKLSNFRHGGVEKTVDLSEYDVEGVIQHAESYLGTRHKMGGTSEQGIDCSGLVMQAHAKFNIALPHSSHELARYGTIILPGEELKRGDLLFFHTTYSTTNLVTHSAIYLGDGKFIHASASKGVVVSHLDADYYRSHYLFATRLRE